MNPQKLEEYSFLWSEVRLLVAAVALFIGGVPPILYLIPVPALFGIIGIGLWIARIISGVAAGYLLYRWLKDKKVFGSTDKKDMTAFFITVVTGLNLGIVGIIGTNIGMSLTSSRIVFFLAGIIYLVTAVYMFKRWKESGRKVF